ncbi:hypothetical protein LCGC14_0865580, partial [marine sediment metagenome]
QQFQEEQGEWANVTFEGQNVHGKLAHLKKEIGELQDDPADLMEYADCFMLLLDAARKVNITADQILEAAWRKLEINKNREWEKPNNDGSVEHIRRA